MPGYYIQCFTYEMRDTVLPRLSTSLGDSGAWLLERRNVSAERAELVFELHPRRLLDLYSALAAAGLELTRTAQHVLIALSARTKHLGRRERSAQTLSIRLEVRFLEDAPLYSVLNSSASVV